MKQILAPCDPHPIHAAAVDKAQAALCSDIERVRLSDFFRVLGDGTRVGILCALDVGEMCVCDLAATLGMTQSAISHQLRALKSADMVRSRRVGRIVYYKLADDHVRDIVEKGLDHIRE